MEVAVLGSSSRGNSIVVRGREGALLVDMGLSYSYVKGALSTLGIDVKELRGVLLTHEHRDHTSGLIRFRKNHPATPVYSTRETLWSVGLEGETQILPGRDIPVGEFRVEAFSVPHDALDPVGFRIKSGGRTFTVSLDVGSVNDDLVEGLRGSNFLVVEANHNRRMLREGPYPFPLKRRIANPLGHLSNDECGRLLRRVMVPETRGVVLAHLSEKNNTPELALYEVVERLLGDGRKELPPRINIEVAKPREVVGPFKV